MKVFLETSDMKCDFVQRVFNVCDSFKISEFQFSSFTVRSDRFTVSPLELYFFKSRHGIATSTEADRAYYRACCPRALKLSKSRSAKSTSGAVKRVLGNCD